MTQSLDKAFERRASLAELQEKGIMRGSPGVAPGLVAKKEELEKRFRSDSLEHSLHGRPSPEKLQEQGILKGSPGVSAR